MGTTVDVFLRGKTICTWMMAGGAPMDWKPAYGSWKKRLRLFCGLPNHETWEYHGHIYIYYIILYYIIIILYYYIIILYYIISYTIILIKYNRRKFRSQTSDNMDRWKAEQGRGREKRKIRREKIRRERVRRKKMQMREKVGKSRNTVFFQWFCGSGGSKSRPR